MKQRDYKRLKELGFEFGQQYFDTSGTVDNEWYDLLLNGKKVGYTETIGYEGPGGKEVEIICEKEEDFNQVVEVVDEEFVVWAWYSSPSVGLKSYNLA